MAKANRSSILLWLQDVLGLQSAASSPPLDVVSSIQPVVEISPKHTIVLKNSSSTATGNATLYTTPADKDFYLTFAALAFTKNAASDMNDCYIIVVPETGTSSGRPMRLVSQTTTAISMNAQLAFPHPIKLARNSAIELFGSFTAGACTKVAAIGGYILE